MCDTGIKKRKLLPFTLFFLCFSIVGSAQADSTFFPDDEDITAAKELDDESDATHEWAVLDSAPKPEVQKEAKPVVKEASVSQPVAAEPSVPVKTEAIKPKPLQLTTVAPHPKVQPVKEKGAPAPTAPSRQVSLPYVDIANDQVPLAILEPTKEANSKRWCLYSAAIRGLKAPSKGIRIVCVEGNTPNRGAEVKDLLVSMGIEDEKIQVLQARGEQDQGGMIYIFGGV